MVKLTDRWIKFRKIQQEYFEKAAEFFKDVLMDSETIDPEKFDDDEEVQNVLEEFIIGCFELEQKMSGINYFYPDDEARTKVVIQEVPSDQEESKPSTTQVIYHRVLNSTKNSYFRIFPVFGPSTEFKFE